MDPPYCPSTIHRCPAPAPPFRFLDLPGEIQNHIASYPLLSDFPIMIHKPRFNRHPSSPPRPRSHPRYDKLVPLTPPLSRSPSANKDDRENLGYTGLALVLTCRLLYHDHWRMYYRENVFAFSLDTFKGFIKNVPARCQSQIQRISFRMPHKHHHDLIWGMLGSLDRLEELEIWLPQASTAEISELEKCLQGVKGCKRLLTFALRRDEGEGNNHDHDHDYDQVV